jgi:hypothetical protein
MVNPHVGPPDPDLLAKAKTYTWLGQSALYRVYHRDSFCPDGTAFRHFGPVSRYDHHEPGLAGPQKSAKRSAIYLSPEMGVVLAEVFGRRNRTVRACPYWYIAKLKIDEQLTLLDLTSTSVMHPGAFASMIGLGRKQSQAWARAVYDKRRDVDGIRYVGSHDFGECIVLWDRAKTRATIDRLIVPMTTPHGSPEDHCLRDLPDDWKAEVAVQLESRAMRRDRITEKQCTLCRDRDRNP